MLILMFWYLQWEGAKRASEQAEGTLKHNYLGSRIIPLQKDEHSLSSADPEPTCKSSPLCLMWLYILYSNREISFYLRLPGHTDVLTSFFLLTSIQSITERHWFAELVFYPGCLDYISCTMGRGGSWDESQLAEAANTGETDSIGKSGVHVMSSQFVFFYSSLSFQKFPTELCARSLKAFTLSFLFLCYRAMTTKWELLMTITLSNLQLAKERGWLITSYNVQQPVLQAPRYIMLHGEGDSVG